MKIVQLMKIIVRLDLLLLSENSLREYFEKMYSVSNLFIPLKYFDKYYIY